jgi:hypothetical protein
VADYTPVFEGGAIPFTQTTSGAVTGGQVLVASAAGTVAAAGGVSAVVVGIAAHDAASGAKVSVWPINNVIHELTCTGTITALDGVSSAAAGAIATVVVATGAAAGTLIGIALTTGTTAKIRFIGRT